MFNVYSYENIKDYENMIWVRDLNTPKSKNMLRRDRFANKS